MRTLDLSPLHRTFIGTDHLTQLMSAAYNQQNQNIYPPYNVEALADAKYQISIAVAGFSKDEIDIQVQESALTVKGIKKAPESKKRRFLHRGLAERNFCHTYQLGDHIKVKGADLQHGLLTINLQRIVPEDKKPQSIVINTH